MFYGFANDWWLAYENNSGAITLSVERLVDEWMRARLPTWSLRAAA